MMTTCSKKRTEALQYFPNRSPWTSIVVGLLRVDVSCSFVWDIFTWTSGLAVGLIE